MGACMGGHRHGVLATFMFPSRSLTTVVLGCRRYPRRAVFSPSLRPLTTSSASGTPETSFPDPSRPDIFYHLIHPPNPLSSEHSSFAITLLSVPPPTPDSCTILGWLPATGPATGLNDFVENRKFRVVLHEAIKTGLVEGVDDIQTARAVQTHSGWMHINDDRNVPALGRINDPEDIFASVLVEHGKILSDTYQAMPSYRLCTADGLPQLTPGLAQKLRALLELRAREEMDG